MAEEYVGRKFKTEFTEGYPADKSLEEEILTVGKKLNDLGLTPENAGNISVRTEKGMLITPGGKNKGDLGPGDLVEVHSFDGKTARASGTLEPSSETPMHWLIYEKYPGIQAVIHVHDQLIVELGPTLGLPTTSETEYGTDRQAREVAELIGGAQYVVIKNHGIVSAGETLEKALTRVLETHASAQTLPD